MNNYEKTMVLLNSCIARKHYTFNDTGYICIELSDEYCGYISPFCNYVEITDGGVHLGYGNIDLDNMMVLDTANRHRYVRLIKKWGAE